MDSGPNSAKALDELEQALAARGRKVEDLELLVITHQHLDHFGSTLLLKDLGVPEKESYPNPEAGISGQPQGVPVKWPGFDIGRDVPWIEQGPENDIPQWSESE